MLSNCVLCLNRSSEPSVQCVRQPLILIVAVVLQTPVPCEILIASLKFAPFFVHVPTVSQKEKNIVWQDPSLPKHVPIFSREAVQPLNQNEGYAVWEMQPLSIDGRNVLVVAGRELSKINYL